MKPRLCRSSWRAFASTHPLIVSATSHRAVLFSCPPIPPWNLPSSTVEPTLSSKCSRFDPPLFCQGAALAHLNLLLPHGLVLWTNGSVSLSFGKGSFGVLASCFLCGTKATLSFSAGPVCSSFSAKACVILQALRWSWQHQQACHFSSLLLLSDSRHPVLSSVFPFALNSLAGTVFFSPVLSGYNESPDSCFSRETTRLISLPDGERYSCSLQCLVVSLLLSLVSTLLFSRTGGIPSYLNSLTHRFSRFQLRNLCSLVTFAVSSLVFAATDTVFFKFLSH